jgi:hypothetical protein
MFAINPSEAALSRWMHPSVARGWLAQITRYSSGLRKVRSRCSGAGEFRALLNCDWVTLDLPRGSGPFSP